MNLDFLFGYQHTTPSTGSNNPPGNTFVATGPPADVSLYKAGQTIQGEVVAVRNNEVILQLEDGGQISARLTKEINLSIGQTMTFEIKSNSGTRLSLSPLFENMGLDPNAHKALSAAGMPASARNLEMVSLLMRQGLPVDKNSLLNFTRQMTMNPTANPATLAQMNRLEIPVTPENIRQFEAYRNYEHQISSAVRDITDGLVKDIGQMAVRGDTDGAVALFKQVLSIFSSDSSANNAGAGNISVNTLAHIATPEQGAALANNGALAGTQAGGGQEGAPLLNADGTSQNPPGLSQAVPPEAVNQNPSSLPLAINQNPANSGATQSSSTLNPVQPTVLPPPSTDPTITYLQNLAPENREQLVNLMREAGFSQALTDMVNNPTLNPNTLVTLLNHELNQKPELFSNPKMATLLTNRDFQTLIKNDINNQWLLKPEEVAKERHVEDFFNKVFAQTAKLIETLNSAGRGDTATAQAASNLNNNINFVNQLNQMFTYIQLPLKMNGENTHSELYVYTNKKNLARKDGNVSALLHLDMEFLGPLDIYISMQQKNVTTKFYLAGGRMIDLVAKHIHILSDRLNERGYKMSSEFIAREPERKPIDEIMEATKNISVVASYSFDARA